MKPKSTEDALHHLDLYNSIQDVVNGVTLSQPARGKNPTKNIPTKTKIQLQPESPHKQHKGHPKSIQLRRTKRLHHWVPLVSYHRRPPHKEGNQSRTIYYSETNKKKSPKLGRKRINPN